MLFTRSSEYALLASIYMAKNPGLQDVGTIAKNMDLSKTFLAKILQTLAKDEILTSFKGINGGFMLAKKTNQIKVIDIINSAEKHKLAVFHCSAGIDCCQKDRAHICGVWPVFNALQFKIEKFLTSLSLQDLINNKQ